MEQYSLMNGVYRMKDVFWEKFDAAETYACFSPGRLNLIVEHTDYNGGDVFQ